jgi:hypothetical protein
VIRQCQIDQRSVASRLVRSPVSLTVCQKNKYAGYTKTHDATLAPAYDYNVVMLTAFDTEKFY